MSYEYLRRKFIVIDGGEGCGKTTQVTKLCNVLKESGLSPMVIRDPGTTRIGERIRDLLLDPRNVDISMRCEMLLYMASRAQMCVELIRPALVEGSDKTVLCDRFISSTLAYQLGGDALTFREILNIGKIATNYLTPDLTIILDVDKEAAYKRVQPKFVIDQALGSSKSPESVKDRIESRDDVYHEQVRENFRDQVKNSKYDVSMGSYMLVDASKDIDMVHNNIIEVLQKRFLH